MADYEFAKNANDRELSSCIWDYTSLRKKLREGPKGKVGGTHYQTDASCQRALTKETEHPELAKKYIAKFAEFDESRAQLIAADEKIEYERAMQQCMEHVHGFEANKDAINVAAFLTRCVDKLDEIPQGVRDDLEATGELNTLTTRHALLLTNFERMKEDRAFKALVDQHLLLRDEKAMLELRLQELEQLPSSPKSSNAIGSTRTRLRTVDSRIDDNLDERKPFYAKYGVVME